MRPVPRTPRVAPFRLTALVVAATLVLSVVPSVPAVADPPDVVYSYAFTGDNEAAWGAGWTHLSSDPTEEYPVLEDNVGVLDASGHGVLSLRPETISDAVQQLKGVFYDPDEDGQTWGLAMRSDGSDFWSDSGYHCIFDYYDNDENPELYIARVSNGVRVWLGEPVEIAVSGDFWLKCEAEGSDLRAKVWADGASEPSAWSVAVSDSTYATGRAGVLLDGVGSVDIVVDDYSLEGFSSAPIPPLDPGGGDTFTDPFVGDDADPWGSEWAHLSSSTGVPFLFGGSGGIDPDDVDLAVTSLRPTTYTDSEQLARVIWYPEGNRHWGLVARHDGAGEGSQSGYYCTLTFDEDINDEEPTLAILRYDSGSLTVLDETVVSVATNQWLKCAAEGDQIMARVWDQGSPEPLAWHIAVTDSTFTSGRVGTFLYGDDDEVFFDDYRLDDELGQRPEMVFSTEQDRSDPTDLDEATVSGDVHVFVSPPDDTTLVEFWVDDPERTGDPVRVDDTAPFDLVGGSVSSADPWDTTALSQGDHTVSAVATLSDSAQVLLAATFTAEQVPEPGAPVSYSDSFTGSTGGPWESGWSHWLSDDDEAEPDIYANQGALDSDEHYSISLRPESVSDAVQQVTIVWDDPWDTAHTWGLAMRTDGGYWSRSGYFCEVWDSADPGDVVLVLMRYTNGSYLYLDEEELAISDHAYLKCEVDGSEIRAKLWEVGDPEPGSWTVEATDSTYPSGLVGILLGSGDGDQLVVDDYELDAIASSEPAPDPGGGEWFTDTFDGETYDPWASGWTHLSDDPTQDEPFVVDGSGLVDPDNTDLAVTSLRPDTYTDSEQIIRAIWHDDGERIFGLATRHDGAPQGAQSGYYCIIDQTDNEDPYLALLRYDTGTVTVLDETDLSGTANRWLKCVVEGTSIRAKAWPQGDEEPVSWTAEASDSTYATGRVGTYLFGDDEDPRIDDYRLGPWPRASLAIPELVLSTTSDRSNPEALDEATVSEDVYVFATPSEDTTQVDFWVDDPTMSGAPDRTDITAPFDLVGGTTTADPWDTLTLSEGVHTVTAAATLSDSTTETLQATVTVDNIPETGLVYSTSADRSSPTGLDQAEVTGDVYVFVDPDDPKISQVDFYVDDPTKAASPARTDTSAPWDLVGGDSQVADPFDTSTLSDGEHTVTADFTLTTGAQLTLTATFDVENVPELGLVHSTSADRSSPDPLNSSTVDGDVYVFVDPDDPDIDGVEFWVDDPLMAGAPVRVDDTAPWDLVGDDGSAADPFDTTTLTEGGHTLTAVVDVDGTPVQLDAAFTVDNLPNTGYTLAGTVFEDAYGNGVSDDGSDSGLYGIDVEVYATDGITLLGSSSTDFAGEYEITSLPGGTVIVRVDAATIPPGVVLTSPTEQNIYVDGTSNVVDVALAPESLGTIRRFPVTIGTGYVDTHSGDGSDATSDGAATTTAFKQMGGVTADEGLLYTATVGAVRVTDTYSGTTRTLAGHVTATGCADSETSTDVRFGTLGAVATDGVYLYVYDPSCGTGGAIRRINISEGSTTTLVELAGVVDMVVAEDGYLYAATATTIHQVDRHTATVDSIHTATTAITALTADDSNLWFADGTNLVAYELAEGTSGIVADLETPVIAAESAGDYLYLIAGADATRLVRWDKNTDTLADVAGSTAGYQDGSGVDALFDGAVDLTTDGIQTLFVADSDNHRLRSVRHDDFHAPGGHAYGNDGYGAWAGDTNAGLGNYVTDHTDFNITTAGPNLGLTRTYNSLDTFAGPFGVGWRFDYEMTWRRNADGDVVVLYPDGRRETHTPDGQGGYTPPDGYYSTLEADGPGFDLTTKDGTTYTFNGDGELTTITDANGRTLTLTYNTAKLDTVTDTASGRTLTFTWAGDRITEVATNTVTAHGGPLFWRYGYDGDGRLVEACDPRTNIVVNNFLESGDPGCWNYEYNENSQLTRIIKPEGNTQAIIDYGQQPLSTATFTLVNNPTSSIEADDPVSWWRFDETSGDFADSGWAGVTLPGGSATYQVDGPGELDAIYSEGLAEIPAPSDLVIHGDLTVEGWVNISGDTFGNGSGARLVRLGYDGELYAEFVFSVSLVTGSPTYTSLWSDGGGNHFYGLEGGPRVLPDSWHHIAVVRSHSKSRYALYVDGRLVADDTTTPVPDGIADVFSIWEGSVHDGQHTNTRGSLSNVAIFDKALSAERIRAHYLEAFIPSEPEQVWRVTDGEGNQTVFDRTQEDEVRVIDGRGFSSYQRYDDQYRLVEEENPLQAVTSYTYDTDGNRDSITDGNENTSTLTYGARRNITSQTNGAGETTYMAYDTDDNLTERRDGRSSSSTDDSYLTEFTYDPARNPTSETDPLGNTRTWEYSDGTETAVGGGTIPAGLLARKVSPRGNEQGTDPADFATVYEYDSDGDLRRVTEPSGLVTEYDHDELGRITEMTVTDSEAQTTATTTYTYDEVGNLLTETLPLFSDSVSAESHQQRTTNVYDANSNLVETTVSDVVGDDDDRTTSFVYDLNDREISVTDPENGTLTRVFDENGNVVSVTDQEGRVTETEYDVRNLPITVTAVDFVDDPVASSTPRDLVLSQAEYDAAGRKISETDAEGRVTSYAYDQADRLTLTERVDHTDADTTIRDVVLSQRVYDDAGNLVSETVGDGTANQLTTTYTFDAAGRPVGSTLNPGGLDRATVITLDANGNPELTTVSEDSRTETTTMVYDETDRLVSVTVENGADDPTTSFDYDERGNQTTVVDPRVNATGATPADYTTTSTYDLLGRLVEVESPTVDVNGGPGTEAPTVAYGYDTFGNRTHTEDANGNVTVSVFDGLDRLAGILHPSYTPPGGSSVNAVEVFGYDAVGNLTSKTSRRGNTTTYAYDNLNRVVAQTDPTITGETGPGVTRFEYDDVGNQTAVVDPRGARVETGYDSLDRVRTRTQVIRVPSSSDLLATTVFDHDDLGNQTYTKDPVDGETHSQYNPASEVVAHQDQAGETTTYQYQLGRMTRVTDPLGRYVAFEYDLAGRRTHQREYDPTDTLLATTGYGYDEAGNQTTVTSPRGFDSGEDPADHTTTHVYDPAGRLVSVEQPANTTETIVTGYGYDLAGNLTRLTDGENNTTVYTYNTYNLVEEVIEPTTSDHPTLADRTWTTSYDAGGLPISETLPGGVTVTRTFDELGRLTAESGSGDGTAGRTLGYDRAGLLTEVDHPDGTIDYGYDDRGLLTEVTGPAGTAGYEYDLAGRMTERVDAAGTTTFAWTPRNELATLTEPATGTTLTYTWDDASQLTSIEYGTSGATRNYTYDNRGRLVSDSLIDTQPMATSTVVYGYDTDSNLTSRNVTLSANTDAGLHGYEYDYADRLISWTHPSTVETDYEWDLAGNRTTAGADTYTYDQRNRLISGPEGDYTYTPRGTLAGIDPGTTPITYAFDPFGRLVEAGAVEYTYDGLDRVAERDTTPFTYNSPGWDPISDNTQTYTRSPSGRVIAVTDGTTSLLAGTDRHGDLTHLHQTTGTVTNTALYDPYGDPLTTTGTFTPTIGYQGDWTDPTSGHVWQGARWYQPATGTFLSRDTIQGELTTPVTLNRYTYANNSPLNYWDPDGHLAQGATGPMIDGQFSVGCAHTGCHRGRTSTNNSPTKHTPATHEPASPKTSGAEAADAALINTARHYGLVGPGTGPSRFDAYLASGACFNNIACGVVGGVAETGKGLVDTFAMMYRSSWINAILDRDSFKQQWVDNALIAGSFATDPVGTIVNPIVDNITTAYNRGGIGQAFGSGLAIAAEIILGAKGTNRLIPRPTPKTVLDDAARLTDDAITPTTPRAVDAADDVVVLGKYPDYVNLADDLGARRFNVPDSVWKGMSNAERWAANQRFLDRAIARGSEIRLASAVTPSNLTGYYAREIEYLVKQGYRISGDDLRMLPPG